MGLVKIKFPPPSVGSQLDLRVNIPSRSVTAFTTATRDRIWAIGGGKGGIGKTLLTSNIAVYLSWLNKKVVVVDMDLGGANLHTSLGVECPTKTLSDIVFGHVQNIEDIIQPTPVRNLFLISGALDHVGIANMRHVHKSRLIRKFRDISADFVLLDLGAGTATNTLDFFLLADKKIVIMTPEPTSIENAYRFMKAAFYRLLRSSVFNPYVRQLIEQVMDQKNTRGIRTPRDLLNEVMRLSPADGRELKERVSHFKLSVILNQVRAKTEGEIGNSVRTVCERYFGITVDYVGYVPYDNAVWQSIRRRTPFLIDAPNSTAVTHLEGILRNLLRVS